MVDHIVAEGVEPRVVHVVIHVVIHVVMLHLA